MMSMVGSYICA